MNVRYVIVANLLVSFYWSNMRIDVYNSNKTHAIAHMSTFGVISRS